MSIEERVASLEKKVAMMTGKKLVGENLQIGDTFTLAGLEWKILDITDQGYACLAERLDKDMQLDGDSNDWKGSQLRKYLNEDIKRRIITEIGEDNLMPSKRDLLSLDGQTEYGSCEDHVSLLTVDEYRKYRSLIPNADYWWWLITPWSTQCNKYNSAISVVSPAGNIDFSSCYSRSGVRPFCIFSPAIFESEDE